ncbi:indole-3-glycerol phosphate synthase TrpC [Thermosinus carboxydivorans]|nr:indole-3-glycerol phosphate synthase TrpC [Thermosinus carboxydivorans]
MLKTILAKKYQEVKTAKQRRPLPSLLQDIKPGNFALRTALKQSAWSLIAECKLASPAKGRLCTQYSVPELAKIYTAHGATALSVLTDSHFCGALADIEAVRAVTELPILRKDFIVDVYQIYEARAVGADAVLLIAGILSDGELEEFLTVAHGIGLDCLVEVHNEVELNRVQQTPALLVGINNRNLKTFTVDLMTTFSLLPHCDKRRIIISESGVKTGEDALRLKAAGVQGILVGEGLVKAENIAAKTRELALANTQNGGRYHAG